MSLAFMKAFQTVGADEAAYTAALGDMRCTTSADELASYLLGRDATQAEQVSAALPQSLRRDGTTTGMRTVSAVPVDQWREEDVEMSAAPAAAPSDVGPTSV